LKLVHNFEVYVKILDITCSLLIYFLVLYFTIANDSALNSALVTFAGTGDETKREEAATKYRPNKAIGL
jgi:hypothetical protein